MVKVRVRDWVVIMQFHFHPFSYVISGRFILCSSLDGVGQEAEDGTDPQQNGEATKQLTAELDPLGGGGGWSQGVGSISGQILCCLRIGQTLSNPNRNKLRLGKKRLEKDIVIRWQSVQNGISS